MIKSLKLALLTLLFVAAIAAPSRAQFADQATDAGTGAGSANAQTISLANVSSYADLVGVLVKFTPGATNTGDTTLSVNGISTPPHMRKPNGGGMVAFTGGEFTTGQQVVVKLDSSGFFNLISPSSLPIGSSGLLNSALSFDVATNLQLNGSVATNALTIAVKGNNGSDPSATNPVLIPFRDSTIANGGPKVVSLQSALSLTIASGSTMGCVSGQMCRLWIVAICSTGLECTGSAGSDVVGLCAFNARSGTSIAPINEAALQSSASGTSGGNSAQTYYCNISSVTARAIRIMGYVDIQEVAAGTWASGPTYVQLFGPGIKRPGDPVQTIFAYSTTSTAGTGATPKAVDQVGTITPTSAANLMRISASGLLGIISGGANGIGKLYRAAGASGACTTVVAPSSTMFASLDAVHDYPATTTGWDAPNTTSQQSYVICISSPTGDVRYCTSGGGNTNTCSIEIIEIMSSRDPDNDNDPDFLRKIG